MCQMLPILEDVRLFNWDRFDVKFRDSDAYIARDAELQKRFRHSC